MKYVICSTTVVQLALYPGHSLKENSLHSCRISIVINTSHMQYNKYTASTWNDGSV